MRTLEPAEVIVYQPGIAPARVTLATEVMTVGRGGDCDVAIRDRFLSRRHADLVWTDEGWVLKDLGSANGTFVNGKRIPESLVLENGDRIELGDAEVVFFSRPMDQDAVTIVPASDPGHRDTEITMVDGPSANPPDYAVTLRDEDGLEAPDFESADTLNRPRPDLPTVFTPRADMPTVISGDKPTVISGDKPTVVSRGKSNVSPDLPTVMGPNPNRATVMRPDPTKETVIRRNPVYPALNTREEDGQERDTAISISMNEIVTEERLLEPNAERLRLVSRLAMELIEERPLVELFDFIVEKIHAVLEPSRAAIAILSNDRGAFDVIRVHPKQDEDLTISKTLLNEVIEEKRVLAFADVSKDIALARADSIVDQQINSVMCAPLLVGDTVLGILYLDYRLSERTISEDDARLAANVARLVASKLETSRLREESLAKQKIDQELRTAYLVQSRILPSVPPEIAGYRFGGKNLPVRTVSGDYFDYVVRKDGKLYFVIADVSGKGITAALLMSGLATAFDIFTREDIAPSALVSELNRTLVPSTAPSKFVTLFVGLLDPDSGKVTFANAGHTPPLWIRKGGVDRLVQSDVVIGLFPNAVYHDHSIRLSEGDVLALFTDGIVEAEDANENELGFEVVRKSLKDMHNAHPKDVVARLEQIVANHVGSRPLADDVTMIVINRE